MSALASNVGADCSLLVSPLKVNVGPMEPEVDDVELELEAELDARSKLHGTATCLPELDDVDALGLVADVLEVLEVLDAPEPFNEITAKSTLPEFGLMITSWMVPSVSPVEP